MAETVAKIADMTEADAIAYLTEELNISEPEAKLMYGFATKQFKGDAVNQHGVDPFIGAKLKD